MIQQEAYQDSCDRNIVESRNGIVKRRFGLDLIMAYLADSAKTEAAMAIFAMNIAHCLKIFLRLLYQRLSSFAFIRWVPRIYHFMPVLQ
jgi:hypothetical protein